MSFDCDKNWKNFAKQREKKISWEKTDNCVAPTKQKYYAYYVISQKIKMI